LKKKKEFHGLPAASAEPHTAEHYVLGVIYFDVEAVSTKNELYFLRPAVQVLSRYDGHYRTET
jgi:hypothetical protein